MGEHAVWVWKSIDLQERSSRDSNQVQCPFPRVLKFQPEFFNVQAQGPMINLMCPNMIAWANRHFIKIFPNAIYPSSKNQTSSHLILRLKPRNVENHRLNGILELKTGVHPCSSAPLHPHLCLLIEMYRSIGRVWIAQGTEHIKLNLKKTRSCVANIFPV
jgi:hypothetical protein